MKSGIVVSMSVRRKKSDGFLDRCWSFQERVEKRLSSLSVSDAVFCRLLGFSMVVTGFVLFFYCVLFGVNVLLVETLSNPLFYFVLGLVFLFMSFTDF